MKKKIFFSLLFLISTLCNAQRNTFNKEAELQKFVERGGKVQLVFPNVYKLTYPDGMSRVYNFNRSDRLNENFEGVDTTIINIWEIDTTKYADRFSFWQKVEVANSYWDPLFIDDLNKNGRPELYGYSDYSSIPVYSGGPVKIFERNTSGIFENVFTYDSSTVFVQGMGDIHGTGGIEIYLRSRLASNGVVYKSDTVGSLPVNFDFIFYYQPNQINDMTFGDFDQNGITECLFVDMNTPSKIIIGEFRKKINNFSTTFEYSTGFDTPSGFAIHDYDLDGKKEETASHAKRFVLSGGLCNMPDVYGAIEKAGGMVVGDDLCTGNRFYQGMVSSDGEILNEIAKRYSERNVCPAKHSGNRTRG
ncbi:MAG: 2-hydroxyacyl-CoA dehydratase family protein, partial [Ignavibacteriaceae bacterium]|nr:2-hydroxyacyl-CoA dehydratase family protein [Ignavibacteriaceae bacterium]